MSFAVRAERARPKSFYFAFSKTEGVFNGAHVGMAAHAVKDQPREITTNSGRVHRYRRN